MKSNLELLEILKLGADPPTVIFPYPIVPLLAFALSIKSTVYSLLISLVFISLYCFSSNIWNHLNDAEIDYKFGRPSSVILLEYSRIITIICLAFYIISGWIVILFSKDKMAIYFYLISVVVIWLYSDRILLGRFFANFLSKYRRFKEHYLLEILTYLIVIPLSSLTLWSFYSKINYTALGFAVIVTLFYLSAVVMKDLKDISADMSAGYKTLAVVASPSTILRISVLINILYYLIIIILSQLNIFYSVDIYAALPLVLVLVYVIPNFIRNSWNINERTYLFIKLYVILYIISLILLTVVSLIVKFFIKF